MDALPLPAPVCPPYSVRDLVETARARIARQAQYAALIAKGGSRAAVARDWLEQAAACVASLARPQAARVPLAARVSGDGVVIEEKLFFGDRRLVADLAAGGRLFACLSTLAYDQAQAFDRLGRDYALFHVQTDLARETLFALARAADRYECGRLPGWRIRRIPVQMHDLRGRAHVWDSAKVQSLLGAFEGANPGVGLTDTGFFQPLHSLLGMTLMRAPG
jgi:hypothetical protein